MRATPRPASSELQAFWLRSGSTNDLSRTTPGRCSLLHDGPPYCQWRPACATPSTRSSKDYHQQNTPLLLGRRARSAGLETATAADRAEVLQSRPVRSAALSPRSRPCARRPSPMPSTGGSQKAGFSVGGSWADGRRLNSPCRGATMRPDRVLRQMGAGGPHLPGLKPVQRKPQLTRSRPGRGRTPTIRRPPRPRSV